MLFDENFWVAFSIIFFIILVSKSIKNSLTASFNDRISSIKYKLDHSFSLKKEAEDLLDEHKKLHKNVTKEVEELLKSAEKEVAHMKLMSEKKMLEIFVTKKIEMLSKIENTEQEFLNKLRLKAIKIAISVSVAALYENDFERLNNSLICNAINSVNRWLIQGSSATKSSNRLFYDADK